MALLRLLIAWALALVLAAAETRFLPGGLRGTLLVDLFLLIAVYYGLHHGPAVGMFVGCLTGLVQDAACGSLLGFNGISKTVAGCFGSWLGGRLSLTAAVPQALILLIATVLDRLVQYILALLGGQGFSGVSGWELLLQAVANALVGAAAFQFVGRKRHGVLRGA